MPERVLLSSIRSLTLYAGELTAARRTDPVAQLECTGGICRDFQPPVIHCTNSGGSNIDIDWKCEADLPSSLRFGRLQVSCEGWDRPGDPYVLKGSCGLTYSLVRVSQHGEPSTDYLTYLLYIAGLLLAIYLFISWLFPRSYNSHSTSHTPHTPSSGGGQPGWGWGRGGGPNSPNDAPPPYTKHPSSQNNHNQPWSPGFWTGLGAGGLAAGMYHYLTRPRDTYRPAATTWDWERTRTGAYRPEPSAARRRPNLWDDGDAGGSWGAGSSTGPGTRLGEMRRATGYGGTSVR